MSNKDNKKSPCPPLHRRYPTTGKCELLKVYQLKRKSSDKNNPDYYVRLMPMSLRELLSDEKYKEEYEKNKDNCKIEVYQDRNLKNKTQKKKEIVVEEKEKVIIKKPKIKILNVNKEVESKKTKNIIKIKKKKGDYYDYLYPHLQNDDFSQKLASQKQFNDNRYDGEIKNIEDESNYNCNASFELMPHQNFVKNFLSSNTPYNSLLLYHGLGSGKTCSAIGIAEETRNYMKQLGINKQIIIVASPNVQDNFRLQLFDERKLKFNNGIWTINSCVGPHLLNEINPSSFKDIPESSIIKQIKALINKHYTFMGYTQFANFISHNINTQAFEKEKRKSMKIKKIQSIFNDRLIVIDEVHNIRLTDDNKNTNKKCAELLMDVVSNANNMRLLLLSATPMYNSHEEIIWLTNLMNKNDKREEIKIADIFDKDGKFKNGKTNGHNLLKRKLTGYVSYVRGENPYLFPVRIYANNKDWNNDEFEEMPTLQLNGKKISQPMENIQNAIFLNKIGDYQKLAYEFIVNALRNNYKDIFKVVGDNSSSNLFDSMDSFGYLVLQKLIEALNIVYPNYDFDNNNVTQEEERYVLETTIGKNGLNEIMKYKKHEWTKTEPYYLHYNFDYRSDKYGKIFSEQELHKYSAKMANICNIIKESQGIILIYSQYIDGGAVPMALSLEEMGFGRFGSESYTKSLLKERTGNPIEEIDSITMEKKSQYKGDDFNQAKYLMITGDKTYSPNNSADIKYLNDTSNKYGKNVKVVIISKAAAEGIDFKNIRQVHILEPWFNMNRIEQIIGRGVRNLSHCQLPFNERNVEIFLHGTILGNKQEATDLYIYRLAEKKAIKTGRVTRLLKEISVDCNLNIEQNNFISKNLEKLDENKNMKIKMPNGKIQKVKFGDKPHTDVCDYMDDCQFSCSSSLKLENVHMTTYNDSFIVTNNDKIISRIKDLYLDIPNVNNGRFFYHHDELINSINIVKKYPLEQIYIALKYLIEKNEYLVDKYGRQGYLINKGKYYVFHPIEITDTKSSLFERSVPVDVKIPNVEISFSETKEQETVSNYNEIIKKIKEEVNIAFSINKISLGEKNWYKNFSNISQHLKDVYDFDEIKLKKYVVDHSLETIDFGSKIEILNHIYNNWNPKDEIDHLIKDYFDNIMLISDKEDANIGFVLVENGKIYKVYVKNDQGLFEKASITKTEDLLRSSSYINKFLIINKSVLNETIGFMSITKEGEEPLFKIRNLTSDRNKKGAVALQAQAKDIVVVLNSILGEQLYNLDNKNEKTKTQIIYKNEKVKYGKNKIIVLLEIIIRYYEDINKEGKKWYLNNEQIVINKIPSYKKN